MMGEAMLDAGRVVKSIAGHDKDRFYAIISVEGDRVTIADGKARKLAAPKAKNVLHVRPTGTTLDLNIVTTDKKLREALGPWNRAAGQEGGN